MSWQEKLYDLPSGVLSPTMTAIVGFVLHEALSQPMIRELRVNDAGEIEVAHVGEEGFARVLCSQERFWRNWEGLLDHVGLDETEKAEATAALERRIGEGALEQV
jgi:hypothetical protein